MKKRQMRNGEITHLPFLCCGNKNQSFLSTPHCTEIVDIAMLTFQYGRRVPAGPALLGRRPAGCFDSLGQSKTTAFLTKTAVSRNGKRLLYIFLTVPSIAWMPLRGKSRTVPMLCRWCANFYFLKKNQQIWGNEYSRFIWEK